MTPEIGRIYTMLTGGGCFYGTGVVFGYVDQPSFLIRQSSGHEQAWMESLCRPATPEEVVIYWHQRAILAEGKLDQITRETPGRSKLP